MHRGTVAGDMNWLLLLYELILILANAALNEYQTTSCMLSQD